MKQVFIGGCQRSGTTMLGAILGSHSEMLCTPESIFKFRELEKELLEKQDLDRILHSWTFKIWGIQGFEMPVSSICLKDFLHTIVSFYGKKHGKDSPRFWVDHTPGNLYYSYDLARVFPEAKFIHIVRDGRAVASSILKLDWGKHTIRTVAQMWKNRVGHALSSEVFLGPSRVLQVRYEDLTTKPEPTLQSICDFLDVSYDQTMLEGRGFEVPKFTQSQHGLVGKAPDASRNEKWKSELTQREVEIFEFYCGLLLRNLGYTPQFGLFPKKPSRWELIRMELHDFFWRRIDAVKKRKRIQQSDA